MANTFFLYCCQYMPKARPIQQVIVYLWTKRDDKDDKLTNEQQSDSNKITLNVK